MIREAGVVIECDTKLKTGRAAEEYDAVLMAIGSHAGVRLPMEGNDLDGVLLNIEFLQNASMGKETGLGKKL